MSGLTDILEEVTNQLSLNFKEIDIPVYSLKVNGEDLDWQPRSTFRMDRDGDIVIDATVEEEHLCDHISEDVMVAYLEEKGYKVTED